MAISFRGGYSESGGHGPRGNGIFTGRDRRRCRSRGACYEMFEILEGQGQLAEQLAEIELRIAALNGVSPHQTSQDGLNGSR